MSDLFPHPTPQTHPARKEAGRFISVLCIHGHLIKNLEKLIANLAEGSSFSLIPPRSLSGRCPNLLLRE